MSNPIDVKYLMLRKAGLQLGNPLGKEEICPDGAGHYKHFQGGSIYWNPKTGAFEVHGAIREKYASLGWEKSFLGYPVTDETSAADGAGRYNRFQGGTIFWSPDTGAFEVHGAIREKYASLGREKSFLGYPVTDETSAADGAGRYNHFQGGTIFWSPDTGAFEVHGAIREKYASLGWEKSSLGYPTTDETSTADGIGRYNNFQIGTIWWTPQKGAWVMQGGGGADEATGSISGRVYGPGLDLMKVFSVAVSGPDDRTRFRERKPFDAAGRYSFTDLPQGKYWVTVDTKADTMVDAHPQTREIVCTGGAVTGIDFELRTEAGGGCTGGEATGSISGKGYGPAFDTWKSRLDISLSGPDDRRTRFDSAGRYSFTSLPPGEYRVSLDSKKWDAVVPITPMTHVINCSSGPVTNVNFKIG